MFSLAAVFPGFGDFKKTQPFIIAYHCPKLGSSNIDSLPHLISTKLRWAQAAQHGSCNMSPAWRQHGPNIATCQHPLYLLAGPLSGPRFFPITHLSHLPDHSSLLSPGSWFSSFAPHISHLFLLSSCQIAQHQPTHLDLHPSYRTVNFRCELSSHVGL